VQTSYAVCSVLCAVCCIYLLKKRKAVPLVPSRLVESQVSSLDHKKLLTRRSYRARFSFSFSFSFFALILHRICSLPPRPEIALIGNNSGPAIDGDK
jgi:hypothetical protein